MNVFLTLLLSYFLIPRVANDFQQKERFEGQFLLTDCLEEIPVSYSTKDKEPFMESVNRLDSVELVLVTAKRRKDPIYEFYYFKKYEGSYGKSAFLVTSQDYHNETEESALFLDYKKSRHFFYRADCFRQKLKEHKQLNEILKK